MEERVEQIDNEVVNGLTSFFDLLARFDFEDKQREKSELKTDSLVSAPRESILDSDI